MAIGRREGFASIASLAALLSCASLSETIPDNQCGNGIVELGAGEDCDTISDPAHGRTCGRAGTSTACRLECDRDPTKAKGCPDGWGCGQDGICREASGAFELRGGGIASDAVTLTSADFNGDGVSDVAAGGPSGIDVFSSPLAGTVTAFDVPAKSADPIVGALSGGSNADLVFVAGARVSVLRGRPDGTLSPQAYPTLSFASDGSSTRMFPIEAQPRQPGKEIITYLKSRVNDTFEIVRAGSDVAEPNAVNLTYAKGLRAPQFIAGDILVGRFVEDDTGCEQFLFGFRGDSNLELYFPCKRDAANAVVPNDYGANGPPTRAPIRIDLPPSTMLAAPDFTSTTVPDPDDTSHQKTLYRAGDFEGDGDLDLYVQLTDSTGGETTNVLLRNDGGGTFTPVPLGSSEFQDVGVAAVPLAFGQLTNGDRIADYIGPHGALLFSAGPGASGDAGAGPGAIQASIVASGDHVWTEARIADFNADGIPDFAAASSDGVDVYRGTLQNLFGGFPLKTLGPAGKLAYGDLDADGAMDLVFRVQLVDPATQERDDAVDVAFGRLHGGPEPPVEVGRFGKAEDVQSAVTGVFGPADGFADIGVYSKSGNAARQNVSFVSGSPDRLLTAPFAVTKTQAGTSSTNVTQTLGVTVAELTGDGHPDLAALVVNRNDAAGPTAANVTFGYELWVVPVTGDAQLDQATLVPATAALETGTAATAELVRTRWGWDEARLAAIDVRPESPALDEIAILVPPLVAALNAPALGRGQVMLAQVDPVTKALTTLGSPVTLGWVQLPVDTEGIPTVLRAKTNWKLRAADVDDDGATDLAMIVDEQEGRRVELLFNHRDGTVDTSPTVVALPNGAVARDVTIANVDGDKEKELVVLTDKGVYVAKVTRGEGSPATATRSVAVTGPVISATDAAGAVAVVAGDFDGDRIDDLAISGGGTLKSFKGKTVLP